MLHVQNGTCAPQVRVLLTYAHEERATPLYKAPPLPASASRLPRKPISRKSTTVYCVSKFGTSHSFYEVRNREALKSTKAQTNYLYLHDLNSVWFHSLPRGVPEGRFKGQGAPWDLGFVATTKKC